MNKIIKYHVYNVTVWHNVKSYHKSVKTGLFMARVIEAKPNCMGGGEFVQVCDYSHQNESLEIKNLMNF